MNHLFVANINDMTENDWNAAKKMDKNDRLIFLTSQDGLMSYHLLPYFIALKNVPDIYPMSNVEPVSFSFFLGTQSAGLNGKCYIISPSANLISLNGLAFETEKGTVIVQIMNSLEEAFEDRKISARKSKPAKAKEISPINDSEAATEPTEQLSNMETSDFFDENIEDENDYPEPSAAFIELLRKYSTNKINLLLHKRVIAECVKDSSEGIVSSFNFQLNMRLGSMANDIYVLLQDHIPELQAALNQ